VVSAFLGTDIYGKTLLIAELQVIEESFQPQADLNALFPGKEFSAPLPYRHLSI